MESEISTFMSTLKGDFVMRVVSAAESSIDTRAVTSCLANVLAIVLQAFLNFSLSAPAVSATHRRYSVCAATKLTRAMLLGG